MICSDHIELRFLLNIRARLITPGEIESSLLTRPDTSSSTFHSRRYSPWEYLFVKIVATPPTNTLMIRPDLVRSLVDRLTHESQPSCTVPIRWLLRKYFTWSIALVRKSWLEI